MSEGKPFASVKDALEAGRAVIDATSESARLDAEVLLGLATGKDRAWLYANSDEALADKTANVFRALLAERARGVPLAHLTGMREFWSLALRVNEHTLVPRPETELLVELALERIPANQPIRILDLGTGTGAIAIALATERADANITATDSSDQALTVAKQNAEQHCAGRIEFFAGNWFTAVSDDTVFDLIVSNPPYIAANETRLTDPELAFEPIDALYSGADGLDAIRQIVAAAPTHLQPGGALLIEHGFAQADAVAQLLKAAGFKSVDNATDLAGNPRVTTGIKP